MPLHFGFAIINALRLFDRRRNDEQTTSASLCVYVVKCGALLFFLAAFFGLNSACAESPLLSETSSRSSIWNLWGTADDLSESASFTLRGQDLTIPDNSDFLFDADGSGDLDLNLSSETNGYALEEKKLADRYDVKRVGESTIYMPVEEAPLASIVISAQYGWKGADDEFGEVYVLYGGCEITQDVGRATAPIAVVWIARRVDQNGNPTVGSRVYAYLEKDASESFNLDLNHICTMAKTNGDSWLGEFQSASDTDLRISLPGEGQLQPDETYFRAVNFLRDETAGAITENKVNLTETISDVENVQRTDGSQTSLTDGVVALGWSDSGDGDSIINVPKTAGTYDQTFHNTESSKNIAQKFSLVDRYETSMSIKQSERSADGKNVWSVSNGFTLVVQGVDINGVAIEDALELSSDSAVIWTSANVEMQPKSFETAPDVDFEVYLDGNVVFRQGNNVVYAKKMYYDVKNKKGIIENAEVVAEAPDMEGAFFRLGADRIEQRDEDTLYATNAWVSTSMMGKPTYRLVTDALTAQRSHAPLYEPVTGVPIIDPKTGKQATEDKQFVIAENNFVTLGSIPVFYWPWMAMDVKDRALYLKSLKFGHDGLLGTQINTSWDLYQLLQVKQRPAGTEWNLDLDYLSRRGLGHGSTFRYEVDSIGKWDTRAVGLANYYGVYDKGYDNLGKDRRKVSFEHKYRYRGIWKHRQELNLDFLDFGWNENCSIRDGWTFTGQIGKSSDRNYIPQYFEDEWNSSSNPETSFELKRTANNRSLGLDFDVRTDTFYTQTNWLPKLDHYWMGQALGDTPFVWYEHSKIGYAQFKTTDSPFDSSDAALFRYLDWELTPDSASNIPNSNGLTTVSGDSLAFSTRHEIDAPFQLGPVKTTPYALGEYGFWGRGVDSKNISRLYGRLGMRFNLPIWKVDADVESQTWYLNGLAHKMNFVVDASYSDSNKDYNKLILYNQIDDWQVQDFRRRYSVTTFTNSGQAGLDAIPVRFDERYYAIRQGLIAGNVSSPSTELADDLQMVRLGWNNRWQTKRGPEGNRHVVDWITFDAGINLYPKHSQNFGKLPGLIDYDARWQVGDRFAVVSSGLYDVFGSGQKITRVGVQRRRPSLSSCYLGVDRLSGPIDSTYLNFGLTYRTSEKWGFGFSNSYDLSEGYNIGQKLTISRIGESFVVTVGANRNESKNNWGVNLTIEPVFFFDKGKRDEGMLGLGNM